MTGKLDPAATQQWVKGWGSPETPSVVANASEEEVHIPGHLKGQGVAVHPSPTLAVGVGWQGGRDGCGDLEQVVEVLQPERSLSHSPVFQVMFNHQTSRDQGRSAAQLPQLSVEDVQWEGRTAQFDLTLNTYESNDGFAAELTYATDLFDAGTVERAAAALASATGVAAARQCGAISPASRLP